MIIYTVYNIYNIFQVSINIDTYQKIDTAWILQSFNIFRSNMSSAYVAAAVAMWQAYPFFGPSLIQWFRLCKICYFPWHGTWQASKLEGRVATMMVLDLDFSWYFLPEMHGPSSQFEHPHSTPSGPASWTLIVRLAPWCRWSLGFMTIWKTRSSMV